MMTHSRCRSWPWVLLISAAVGYAAPTVVAAQLSIPEITMAVEMTAPVVANSQISGVVSVLENNPAPPDCPCTDKKTCSSTDSADTPVNLSEQCP